MSSSISIRTVLAGACASSVLFLAACASEGPPPVGELATARASLAQAESSGAAQLAPSELLSARDKLTKADIAQRDKQYREARRLAEESAADADLAERKARAMKSARAAEELQRSNGVLATEINRPAR